MNAFLYQRSQLEVGQINTTFRFSLPNTQSNTLCCGCTQRAFSLHNTKINTSIFHRDTDAILVPLALFPSDLCVVESLLLDVFSEVDVFRPQKRGNILIADVTVVKTFGVGRVVGVRLCE